MDRLLYDTCYPIMDENGVDLNMELGSPGWLDLKKVILRFFQRLSLIESLENLRRKLREQVISDLHIERMVLVLKVLVHFLVNLIKKK